MKTIYLLSFLLLSFLSIAQSPVTNDKLNYMNAKTVKGNPSNSSNKPQDITIDSLKTLIGLPRQVFTGLFIQGSDSIPVVTTLRNTMDSTITFSKSVGRVVVTCNACFPVSKTWVSITNGASNYFTGWANLSQPNSIYFYTNDGTDIKLFQSLTPFEIRVYP